LCVYVLPDTRSHLLHPKSRFPSRSPMIFFGTCQVCLFVCVCQDMRYFDIPSPPTEEEVLDRHLFRSRVHPNQYTHTHTHKHIRIYTNKLTCPGTVKDVSLHTSSTLLGKSPRVQTAVHLYHICTQTHTHTYRYRYTCIHTLTCPDTVKDVSLHTSSTLLGPACTDCCASIPRMHKLTRYPGW
jgi:hypothetical protein